MLKKSTIFLLLVLIVPIHLTFSQNVKFGKVSNEELQEKFHPLDSSSKAAYLYKYRRSYFKYEKEEGFYLVTDIHERIKIYNKEGFDYATKSLFLFKRGGNKEKINRLKGNTYNLINGKIEESKLKKESIFYSEYNKYRDNSKFTMPNIKIGSVIEYRYTIVSPFYSNIDEFVFQNEIPIKKLDAKFEVPEYFKFKVNTKGYLSVIPTTIARPGQLQYKNKIPLSENRNGDSKIHYREGQVEFTKNITNYLLTDVPAIKDESHVNNIDNYRSAVKYELSYTEFPGSTLKYYNTTWDDVTKSIYKSSNFGEQLKKVSHFKDDVTNLTSNASSSDEKILAIYNYVKSKIKWNNFRGKYTDQGVKKAYKEGTGNVAEINLTLVAMLRTAGLKANPVLVSTRDNGVPLFPTSQGFNYVIAGVELTNSTVLLDATEIYAPPNVLPLRALNWQGRMIRKDGSSIEINLSPKKYSAKKVFVNVKINEDALISGSCRAMYYNLKALNYRNGYNKVNNQDLIRKLEKDNDDIEISKIKVSNEDDISRPLGHTFAFETDNQVEIIGDKMYFAPLLFLTEKENPFKLEKRTYPVDFGTPFENRNTVSINLPEGYEVESKPEDIGYTLPDGIGSFKYVTMLKGNTLQILSNTKINMGVIGPNYYVALKEFYKKIIEKQVEKIVLKKK